mgnify:CR=1 FL=1
MYESLDCFRKLGDLVARGELRSLAEEIHCLRLGERQPADSALRFLESVRCASGGFFGSYGLEAAHGADLRRPFL